MLGAAESLAREVDSEWTVAVREARARVEHGVGEELLELVSVGGVGRKRARRLYEAGIEEPADLRTADKGVVLAVLKGKRPPKRSSRTRAERTPRWTASSQPIPERNDTGLEWRPRYTHRIRRDVDGRAS